MSLREPGSLFDAGEDDQPEDSRARRRAWRDEEDGVALVDEYPRDSFEQVGARRVALAGGRLDPWTV
jgi:hypothetical protein